MADTNITVETAGQQQPDDPTLAKPAAEVATPAPEDTGLESGMKVITTPQGKASIDKNAPDLVADAFTQAASASAPAPRANAARGKGKLVVQNAQVTTAAGKSFSAGDLVDPKDLSDDEKDLFTTGDSPALVPFESLGK